MFDDPSVESLPHEKLHEIIEDITTEALMKFFVLCTGNSVFALFSFLWLDCFHERYADLNEERAGAFIVCFLRTAIQKEI
jgi:hypothetical protein